jgi:hypothetical protein
LTGCQVSAGEEETAGWRITSASHAHGRMVDNGKRRGDAGRGSGGSVAQGGRHPERIGLEWAEVGPPVRISKETTWAIKVNQAELTMGCGKLFS